MSRRMSQDIAELILRRQRVRKRHSTFLGTENTDAKRSGGWRRLLQRLTSNDLDSIFANVFNSDPDCKLQRSMFIRLMKTSVPALNEGPEARFVSLDLSEIFAHCKLPESDHVKWDHFSSLVLDLPQNFTSSESLSMYRRTPLHEEFRRGQAPTEVFKYFDSIGRGIGHIPKEKVAFMFKTCPAEIVSYCEIIIRHLYDVILIPDFDVFVASVDNKLTVWDSTFQTIVGELEFDDSCLGLVYHTANKTIYACFMNGDTLALDLSRDSVDFRTVPFNYPRHSFSTTDNELKIGRYRYVLTAKQIISGCETNICPPSGGFTFMYLLKPLNLLAAFDTKGGIYLFDLGLQKVVFQKTVHLHKQAVLAAAYSESLEIFATSGYDRDILLWSPFDTTVIHRLEGHRKPVSSLHARASGTELLSCDTRGTVRVWDLLELRVNQVLKDPQFRFSRMIYDEPQKHFYGITDKHLLTFKTYECCKGRLALQYSLSAFCFNSRFRNFVVGADTDIFAFSMSDGNLMMIMDQVTDFVVFHIYSVLQDSFLLVLDTMPSFKLVNYSTGKVIHQHKLKEAETSYTCQSGNDIVVLNNEGDLSLFQVSPERVICIQANKIKALQYTCFASSEVTRQLVTCSSNCIYVWNVDTGLEMLCFPTDLPTYACSFAQNDSWLITGGEGGMIQIFSSFSYEVVTVIETNLPAIGHLMTWKFNATEYLVSEGKTEGEIITWDLKTLIYLGSRKKSVTQDKMETGKVRMICWDSGFELEHVTELDSSHKITRYTQATCVIQAADSVHYIVAEFKACSEAIVRLYAIDESNPSIAVMTIGGELLLYSPIGFLFGQLSLSQVGTWSYPNSDMVLGHFQKVGNMVKMGIARTKLLENWNKFSEEDSKQSTFALTRSGSMTRMRPSVLDLQSLLEEQDARSANIPKSLLLKRETTLEPHVTALSEKELPHQIGKNMKQTVKIFTKSRGVLAKDASRGKGSGILSGNFDLKMEIAEGSGSSNRASDDPRKLAQKYIPPPAETSLKPVCTEMPYYKQTKVHLSPQKKTILRNAKMILQREKDIESSYKIQKASIASSTPLGARNAQSFAWAMVERQKKSLWDEEVDVEPRELLSPADLSKLEMQLISLDLSLEKSQRHRLQTPERPPSRGRLSTAGQQEPMTGFLDQSSTDMYTATPLPERRAKSVALPASSIYHNPHYRRRDSIFRNHANENENESDDNENENVSPSLEYPLPTIGSTLPREEDGPHPRSQSLQQPSMLSKEQKGGLFSRSFARLLAASRGEEPEPRDKSIERVYRLEGQTEQSNETDTDGVAYFDPSLL
jgi:WD40 repeat protein